jgi:plastocyanin
MPKPYFAGLLLATTMLVAACGGNGNGCCDPFEQSTVSKGTQSGDAQTGTVGQVLPLPLQVVVTTAGTPTPGITVNWSTTAGEGTLSPTSSVTDAAGVATSTWTLGTTAGAQTATATVTGATGSPVTFSASAVSGAAVALEDGGNNGQTGEVNTALTQPLVAIVTDGFGNAVAGVDVNWEATGATLSAATDVTDAAGVSAVTVTLGGTAGLVTITASSEGLEGSPVTFTAVATEATPSPATAAVTVQDNSFISVRNSTAAPAVDTVEVGGTVTWTWAPTASSPHNITSAGSASFTGRGTVTPPPVPDPYAVSFSAAGTYNYYCSIHGSPTTGMRGRIVVR